LKKNQLKKYFTSVTHIVDTAQMETDC